MPGAQNNNNRLNSMLDILNAAVQKERDGSRTVCVISVNVTGGRDKPYDHLVTHCVSIFSHFSYTVVSGVPRGGVWGVQTPPEIPKISVESSIAQASRIGVSISFCSSLCSHTVVIY